ncbi:MAG: NAD(P)H-hydrate dehydratase [Dehalococcoidia bacterium]|nr:NAD(P)H-hydrate dehydratase [Dehalococcoidia bacterium]
MKIVTVDQMQALEEASAAAGTSTDTLMENAGLAVARLSREAAGGAAGVRVLVLVGPGNNGGDGLVAARHLRRWGAEVTAYVLRPRRPEDTRLDEAAGAGVTVLHVNDDPQGRLLAAALRRARVVLDAVLGTGRARPLEGEVRDAMLAATAARAANPGLIVVCLDVPTGMDADTGAVDPACPRADLTVSFGFPKVGHFRFPGAAYVGRLRIVDIGISPDLSRHLDLELLTGDWVGERLPDRPSDSHKGTFGHALIVAGSTSYAGAAYLAAQAAARMGPGLVTLASPRGIYPVLASKLTEVIHLPLPQDEDGRISAAAAGVVGQNLAQYSSVVLGCGFGRSAGLVELLQGLLVEEPGPRAPVVVDADGLNNLARIPEWWRRTGFPLVVTPHPGEMATLTSLPTAEVQSRRVEVAREYAAKWDVVVALKGAHTVVASPDGLCRVSPFANPGLSSGGTGDVLTGIIGGLLAQGLSPEDAACCGVYLHGMAGEMARERLGDAGMLAGDLLSLLPAAVRDVRLDRPA